VQEGIFMAVLLKYKVIREFMDGSRAKRARSLYRWSDNPLKIGGLYSHIGSGYPGMQRILSVEETSITDSNNGIGGHGNEQWKRYL